jgi:hypothetical protein
MSMTYKTISSDRYTLLEYKKVSLGGKHHHKAYAKMRDKVTGGLCFRHRSTEHAGTFDHHQPADSTMTLDEFIEKADFLLRKG